MRLACTIWWVFFFFFQAEDGIRDYKVTGVQTCALPIFMAIGFPRLKNGLEKQNIRSSKALLTTLVATARGTAVQRGCNATLNMTADSVWVTACGVNPPAASVTVGTKKLEIGRAHV